ncbi:MAG TPA: alanine racemase, partial [Methylophilaceae bacterium]|nr:alanine racemase [Methylophilaceae bacterium]
MKATSVPTATRPEITCPWGAPYTDQTWVEVDCAALRHNLAQYKGILGEEVKLMPIVKANAYGHGLLAVSRELIGAGVDILGVVNINEALRLREEGISKPVLVLGYTDPRRVAEIPAQNPIALAVYDLETARAIAEVANNSGRIIPLHLKVDSGLHRLGMVAEEAVDFAKGVADLPGVSLAGLFTHFAAAETPEHEYTAYQFGRFSKAIRAVRAAGFTLEYVHATASAGALCLPETRLNLVRLGIALYGLWPSAATKLLAEHAAKVPYLALLPALSWQARVIQVKDLSAGVAVGYGC